jgi:hypothetical protein
MRCLPEAKYTSHTVEFSIPFGEKFCTLFISGADPHPIYGNGNFEIRLSRAIDLLVALQRWGEMPEALRKPEKIFLSFSI